MEYAPALVRNTSFELDTVADTHQRPPLYAVPDLIACHRLSMVAAPIGAGLTQFALHIAATLAQPGADHLA